LVHSETKATPFERYFGTKPDLSHLKVFGSRVCVKRSGDRSSKLDRNDFTGIFLGFTVTDHNILYLDMDSGLVKRSHHTQFDEAWYLQSTRPPAAQLLYDLGLEVDSDDDAEDVPQLPSVPWPPLATCDPACAAILSIHPAPAARNFGDTTTYDRCCGTDTRPTLVFSCYCQGPYNDTEIHLSFRYCR